MEQYLGVKLVSAEPMSSDNFELYKKGLLRNNNTDNELQLTETDKPGYKVVYEDSYTSWSPKDVFEKAYRKIKTRNDLLNKEILLNNSYKVRVFDECSELQDKVEKLQDVINQHGNNIYQFLSKEEQIRMQQQLMAMQYYLTILVERIENF